MPREQSLPSSSVPQNRYIIPGGRSTSFCGVVMSVWAKIQRIFRRKERHRERKVSRAMNKFSNASLLHLSLCNPLARSVRNLTLFAYEQIVPSLFTYSIASGPFDHRSLFSVLWIVSRSRSPFSQMRTARKWWKIGRRKNRGGRGEGRVTTFSTCSLLTRVRVSVTDLEF